MSYELLVSPEARGHIREGFKWWRRNRDKAPMAFMEDLRSGFRLIREHPELGLRSGRRPRRYRYNLRRIRYTIYAVDETRVTVLAVWQSSRGEQPDL